MQDMSDSEDETFIKSFRQSFKPTKQDIIECQILLDLMGIPYMIAPGEADALCAWLTQRNDANGKRYAKGICSDDSDMLPLGGAYLFKDMLKFLGRGKQITVFSLNKTLVKMNLTMDQFQDLCVMLGCDYCDNIRGIGPKTAYKMIVQHGTLENVIKFLNNKEKYKGKIDAECLIAARNYFRTVVADIDNNEEFVMTDDNIKLRKFQQNELIDFMCIKHNFDIENIDNGIHRLRTAYRHLGVTRPNTKKVHTISKKPTYLLTSDQELDFLPDEESGAQTETQSESQTESQSKPTAKAKVSGTPRKMVS